MQRDFQGLWVDDSPPITLNTQSPAGLGPLLPPRAYSSSADTYCSVNWIRASYLDESSCLDTPHLAIPHPSHS